MMYGEKTGKSITKGQQDVSLCKYFLVICGKPFHALRLVSSLLKMAAGVAGAGARMNPRPADLPQLLWSHQ